MDDRVGVVKAAEVLGLDRHVLRSAAAAGRVPSVCVGTRFLFDLDELAANLPTCRYPGCDAVALGESGGCESHGHVLLGARAKGVKRPDIGPRISAAKIGHAVSPETRRKLSLATRKGEPVVAYCVRCDKQIIPKRPGLEDVSPELLSELGLDRMPSSVVEAGRGRFCEDCGAPAVKMSWLWENERDRFHPGDGPTHFPCDVCGIRKVIRWPSQEAVRDAGSFRWRCEVCHPILRKYLMRARRAVDRLAPDREWERSDLVELEAVAAEYEAAMLKTWPPGRPGRRPSFGRALMLEALCERGFSDRAAANLMGYSKKWAEMIRYRARIRRRRPGDEPGLWQFAP